MPVRDEELFPKGTPIPAALDLQCTSCGYDLTGLTVRRCPECGTRFNLRDARRVHQPAWGDWWRETCRYPWPTLGRLLFWMMAAGVVAGLFQGRGAPLRLIWTPVVVGEFLIWWYDARPLLTRLIYMTACTIWVLADPFG